MLLDKGVIVYGLYASGTIVFSTDGNTIAVQDNPTVISELPFYGVTTLMLSMSVISVTLKKIKYKINRLASLTEESDYKTLTAVAKQMTLNFSLTSIA